MAAGMHGERWPGSADLYAVRPWYVSNLNVDQCGWLPTNIQYFDVAVVSKRSGFTATFKLLFFDNAPIGVGDVAHGVNAQPRAIAKPFNDVPGEDCGCDCSGIPGGDIGKGHL